MNNFCWFLPNTTVLRNSNGLGRCYYCARSSFIAHLGNRQVLLLSSFQRKSWKVHHEEAFSTVNEGSDNIITSKIVDRCLPFLHYQVVWWENKDIEIHTWHLWYTWCRPMLKYLGLYMMSIICCCVSRGISYKLVLSTVCKISESSFQIEKYSKQNCKNDLRLKKNS